MFDWSLWPRTVYVTVHFNFIMDLPTALQKLATYRTNDTRASQDTFDKGLVLLKSNAVSKMGDESAREH